MFLTAIGWLAAVTMAVATIRGVRHGVRTRDYAGFAIAGLYASAAVILLAMLGALNPAAAGLLAALAAGTTAAISVKVSGRKAAGTMAGFLASAAGFLGRDFRSLLRRAAGRFTGQDPQPAPAGEAAAAAAAVALAARVIPSLREDPALGAPPEPDVIASASPVPPPYAALASWIGGFEAEDDQALRMFMEGCAAGNVAVAAAWHQAADRFMDSRLHPAYVAGILEVGDSEAESAGHKVQAHRRFAVIYGAVKDWISAYGPLPKDGDFLTGEDAA